MTVLIVIKKLVLCVLYLEESLGLGDHVGEALRGRQVLAQVPLVRTSQAVLPVTGPAAATTQDEEQRYFYCLFWSCGTNYNSIRVFLLQRRSGETRLCDNTEMFSAPRCQQINPGGWEVIIGPQICSSLHLMCFWNTWRVAFTAASRAGSHSAGQTGISVTMTASDRFRLFWKSFTLLRFTGNWWNHRKLFY